MNIFNRIKTALFGTRAQFKGEMMVHKLMPDGSWAKILHHHNLVVTTGKNFAAGRLFFSTADVLSAIGVGTDSTAPAIANTALGAELQRLAFDSAATQSANVVSCTSTFGPGVATGNWSEAGLFNATSAGTMFSRTTFTAVPKGSDDTISITWNVKAN